MAERDVSHAKEYRKRYNKKRRRRKSFLGRLLGSLRGRILLGVLALLVIGGIAFAVIESGFVYAECRVEAGTEVSLEDFLKKPDDKAYFTEDSEQYNVHVPGRYKIKIKTGAFVHPCVLIVEDTVAPVIEARDIQTGRGIDPDPADCVVSVTDETKTTATFASAPNVSELGEVTAELVVTDLGGNTAKATVNIDVWPIKARLKFEAGSKRPELKDFMLDADLSGAKFVTDIKTVDMSKVGEHPVKINYKGTNYNCKVVIVDTTPPQFTVKNIESFLNVPRKAEDFVTASEDNSSVTFSFEREPNLKQEGTQELVIIAADEGGNEMKKTVKLTLNKDTEAPKFEGSDTMEIFVGQTISYRSKIKATDNCPEGLRVEFDAADANTNKAGTYDIKATATDLAGNVTEKTFTLKVKDSVYTEEELWKLCDEVLNSIGATGKSSSEKVRLIYKYARENVRYWDHATSTDWIKAAGDGILFKKGDCYNVCMMLKALLTRAGVKNFYIKNNQSGENIHYWNVVDIGDGHGWYHLDGIVRGDDIAIYLYTQEQVEQVDIDSGTPYHQYDKGSYPEIP